MEEVMNVVIVGHVDHGKSTIIGRLLADTDSLPEGKLQMVKDNCKRNSKPFEYAFLLDALKDEQSQGITIDTARCFFKTKKRDYILIDAPGHIEFLKNMVTGASRADAALMVIDAHEGVEENTRRHSYFLSMLGIKQIAVLVNKMDLVGFKQSVFEDIKETYTSFLSKIGVEAKSFIPVSGYCGDNIASVSANMPWFKGGTVLTQLDEFESTPLPDRLPFRMPVQGVYKFTAFGDSRRIIAGTVESGKLNVGDKITFWPSGKQTTVKTIEVWNAAPKDSVSAGEAAGFTMTEQIYIRRGEIACRSDETPPHTGVRFRANLFWLGRERLQKDKHYFLKCGTAKVDMILESVERVVNASNLSFVQRQYVEKNEVAECILRLDYPIAFDRNDVVASLGRFVVVDDYELAGGGIITEPLSEYNYDTRNIRWSGGSVNRLQRRELMGHDGLVVWMTGLSGSGKTTVSQEVERRLVAMGVKSFIIDGDVLRNGLNSDLGFSEQDRIENIRRAANVAALMKDAGLVTLVSLISPYEKSRAEARKLARGSFMEVYVKASLETCMKRDPKKLYKKAKAGGIKNFTGIDSPYEEPQSPDVLLDTELWSEEECVETLIDSILGRINFSGSRGE